MSNGVSESVLVSDDLDATLCGTLFTFDSIGVCAAKLIDTCDFDAKKPGKDRFLIVRVVGFCEFFDEGLDGYITTVAQITCWSKLALQKLDIILICGSFTFQLVMCFVEPLDD
jgi:hypothetical protein